MTGTLKAYYRNTKGLSVSIKIRADMRLIWHMKYSRLQVRSEELLRDISGLLIDGVSWFLIDVCVIGSNKVVSFILMVNGQSDWGLVINH